jgi:Flp pilus assembly protein TadG
MVIILGFAALVVDVGYLANARSELQRAADAAALSASWQYAQALSDKEPANAAEESAVAAANAIVGTNDVCKSSVAIDASDLRLGYLSNLTDRSSPLDTSDPSRFNAIEVTVRRSSEINGRVPFFFARIFGMSGTDAQASATAAMLRNIRGFRAPADGTNVDFLPIALDLPSWNYVYGGNGNDDWKYDEETKTVIPGHDDIPEINLYPKGNGAAGNRGMVDIGSSNNSTADIARQIVYGISESDLAYFGGKLELGDDDTLDLNGDTGISAGVKDELQSIVGQTRCIPIFNDVNGPGNNAVYTICTFAGIRIMEVNLTGSKNNKRLIVQPAVVMIKGGIPSDDQSTSDDVFSPIFLVR